MDGIVGMKGRGPANGKPRRMDVALASRDGVALDASAMRLVGLEPRHSGHIALAAEQALGNVEADDITLDDDWQQHSTQFEPAVLDKAIATMDYMSRYRWFVKYALKKDHVFLSGQGPGAHTASRRYSGGGVMHVPLSALNLAASFASLRLASGGELMERVPR